jgi:hypothetical protein
MFGSLEKKILLRYATNHANELRHFSTQDSEIKKKLSRVEKYRNPLLAGGYSTCPHVHLL